MTRAMTNSSRSTIFIVTLALSVLLGANALAAQRVLSIEEAVQLAQAADIDYQIATLTWENAQIDDRTARAAGQMTPYDQLQQDLRIRRAQHTFNQAHTNLVLGVIRDYVNLIQSQNQLHIRERQLEVARAQLERVHEMVRIGNATEQDRLREINRVASAELSAVSSRRTYESRHASFAQRLGLSDDVQLVLNDTPVVTPFDYTLEEALATARAVSFDVWEREVNLTIAQMDLENLKSQNPAPLALQKAENNFVIQQLNAIKSEGSFATQTTNSYHSVADAWTQLQNSERDYIVATETYNQGIRQYEAGLRTDLDKENNEIDHLSATQTIVDARNNYAIALIEFEVTLGKPLPYGEEAAR